MWPFMDRYVPSVMVIYLHLLSFIPFRLEKVQIVKYTSASVLTNIDVVGTGGLINSYLKDNELSPTGTDWQVISELMRKVVRI